MGKPQRFMAKVSGIGKVRNARLGAPGANGRFSAISRPGQASDAASAEKSGQRGRKESGRVALGIVPGKRRIEQGAASNALLQGGQLLQAAQLVCVAPYQQGGRSDGAHGFAGVVAGLRVGPQGLDRKAHV